MIAITAKPAQGFYRCGVHHAPTRTLHADDKFDKKQLKILKSEPALVVEEGLPNPKPEKGEAPKSGEGGDPRSQGTAKPGSEIKAPGTFFGMKIPGAKG